MTEQFLYRQTSKHHDLVRIVDSYDEGVAEAKKFVGDHNPVDGCSAPPIVSESRIGGVQKFAIARQTSFGERRATVQPVNGKLMELL